ncbi:hypothetical protein K2X33_02330 [bacterium]|nr:hypothetical protein [bacterium]
MKLPNRVDPASFRVWLSAFEVWITKASHIAVILGRGAYWSGERRRLLALLGQKTLELTDAGALTPEAVDPLVQQIKRIQDKLEREQSLIQDIRSGEQKHEG